ARGRRRRSGGFLLTSEAGHTHERRGPRLTEYVYIFSRRKWLVLASVLSIVTTVGLLTLRAPPLYRAVASLPIERPVPNIMKFQEIAPYDPSYLSYQDYYQTQYQLLRSRAVAARAVSRLALSADPEFSPAPAGLLSRMVGSLTKPLRAAVPEGAA